METDGKLRLADAFVSTTDPRQPGKVKHDLTDLLVVAVNAMLVGADKTPIERRFHLSSLPLDANRLARAIRARWSVDSCQRWIMDVAFADD